MQSTDKTKPTHTDYLALKKTTQLNLRGLSIEWAVLDRTLTYATEMEEKTRPKDFNPEDGCKCQSCKKPTPNTKDARA